MTNAEMGVEIGIGFDTIGTLVPLGVRRIGNLILSHRLAGHDIVAAKIPASDAEPTSHRPKNINHIRGIKPQPFGRQIKTVLVTPDPRAGQSLIRNLRRFICR